MALQRAIIITTESKLWLLADNVTIIGLPGERGSDTVGFEKLLLFSGPRRSLLTLGQYLLRLQPLNG